MSEGEQTTSIEGGVQQLSQNENNQNIQYEYNETVSDIPANNNQ